MRVLDLDKFSLEQIWRPYQTMVGYERRLEKVPMSLTDTLAALKLAEGDWPESVLDRIARINPTFPPWISHPLVDYLKSEIKTRRKALADGGKE